MKTILRIFIGIVIILILIIGAGFAYLNFLYLPKKVRAEGPAYLEQKSNGLLQAESIQYIPFKGVELKDLAIVSQEKQPVLVIERAFLKIHFWPLITRRKIDFRIELYPRRIKQPLIVSGLYQIKQQALDLDLQIKTDLFIPSQTVNGQARVLMSKEKQANIAVNLDSPDLNLQGNFYIDQEFLRIEKFSASVLGSTFDFIGDVQELNNPTLNIYGNLNLNLAGLEKLNPQYLPLADKLKAKGACSGEIFISAKPDNPLIGLKMKSGEIKIEKVTLRDLAITAKMENKTAFLSKLYAKLCAGEVNLQGDCSLDSPGLPANLNFNLFNLDLNKIIADITGKDTPVHGRLFSLGKINGSLQDWRTVTGQVWLSAAGSNILQFRLLKGISEILRLPQLSKIEFKEAGGNFSIAQQVVRTADFKISSNIVDLYYKGYINFKGDLSFDVEPHFSQGFLSSAPDIGNILGIFIDSTTGSFLGEIKLKGSIKEPRYTFKPVSIERIFPQAIEKQLKGLFKFRNNQEE